MSIAALMGLIAWLFVSAVALGSFAYGSAVGYRKAVEDTKRGQQAPRDSGAPGWTATPAGTLQTVGSRPRGW
jgi:hypothetical protein